MSKNLVVIIATANRPELLGRTLSSLSACGFPPTFSETIIVENGPIRVSDAVAAKYAEVLKVRYIHVPTPGKGRALNVALQSVRDALVIFTDDDVRFKPDFLLQYARATQRVDRGQFFGGPVGVDYERQPPYWLRAYLPASASGWGLSGRLEDEEWQFFLGANWAAHSADLRSVGGFNADIGPGSSTGSTGVETFMQQELLRLGLDQVFVPEAMLWHYVPAERCSKTWALKRSYRNAVFKGIRMDGCGRPHILGVQRWMIRAWLGAALRTIPRAISTDPVARFESLRLLAIHTGMIRGYRWGRSARS